MRKLSDTLTYILDRPTYLNKNNMELRETYDNICLALKKVDS